MLPATGMADCYENRHSCSSLSLSKTQVDSEDQSLVVILEESRWRRDDEESVAPVMLVANGRIRHTRPCLDCSALSSLSLCLSFLEGMGEDSSLPRT